MLCTESIAVVFEINTHAHEPIVISIDLIGNRSRGFGKGVKKLLKVGLFNVCLIRLQRDEGLQQYRLRSTPLSQAFLPRVLLFLSPGAPAEIFSRLQEFEA
jgi:hypothetical protein